MRKMRDDHLREATPVNDGLSGASGSIYQKAVLADCLAMTLSAYNGTPAQPQLT